MKAKTIVYLLLAGVLLVLVWQYVLPTANFSLKQEPQAPASAEDAIVQGLKKSYGYWILVDEGEHKFTAGEKYTQDTLGVSSTFGNLKFFCAKGCVGTPEQAYIKENFTARVLVHCPGPNAGYCCIGIGYDKLDLLDVC